jgi:succinyl-diaminopimelate desuccinylase
MEGLFLTPELFIQENKETMTNSLVQLLQIPSVKGSAHPLQPFGSGPAHALQYVLDLAQQHGFLVKNVDGYAGHVEYGDGEKYVAVLSHLDVVPEGTGWTYPPFGAEIHDGRIYARGAIDDKGPALSTLWALIAMKAAGLSPKRKIRLIFGLDEESGWDCVRHYFSKEPLPLGGFTPDADFPFIHAEKGVATLRIESKYEQDAMSPQVVRLDGGHRVNMVPDYCTAEVECHSETAALEWEQKLLREARILQADLHVDVSGSRIVVTVHGVSAHGSTPQYGVNAIVQLATLLSSQCIANASMWRLIATQDVYGKGIGIEDHDEVTGPLTSNLGRAYMDNQSFVFLFNIRYPVKLQPDILLQRCQSYLPDKWCVQLVENSDPLYVPLDSPVVQVLSRVYEESTGDHAEPLAIGGATYARAIPNAVAFGALFPGQSDLAHQKDEYWLLDDYFRCIQIYAQAMLELANTL